MTGTRRIARARIARSTIAHEAMEGPMATEFSGTMSDAPGRLANLGQALGDARVNIEAIFGIARAGEGLVRFVTDNTGAARSALEKARLGYTVRDVVIVRVFDTPGALGELA